MTQDVEMKDNQTPTQSIVSDATSTLQHLKEIAALIDTGSYTKEVRRIARAVRLTVGLRRKLTSSVISSFLDFALVPGSEAHTRLSSFVPKSDEHDMEVDTASSTSQAPSKHLPAELEIYCYFIVLLFLIDQKNYTEAKACSSASIARLKSLNRRTVDVIAARLYFYYSLSYEMTGDLAEIRGTLLSLHHSATLRHDELGQETLLNLLLRNYLHYNLYDQAEKLRSKAPRFEAHSNRQVYFSNGRGRGRNSRGRGRGGYNGPPNEYDAPQDGGYGYDAPYEQRGYDDHGGYDAPPQRRGGYDGPSQGRGSYEGPQGRGSYEGPQGRGGYDAPQGRGRGRGRGRGGRGRGGGRGGGFNYRSDGPPVEAVA